MSRESSNSTEEGGSELGQLSDRLEGTSLDGSGLVALIREAKASAETEKDGRLEKAIASVKSALEDKSVSTSTLMECEELLPVLISGLETDSSKVQLDVTSVLALILETQKRAKGERMVFGSTMDPQKEMIIGSGIIRALVPLLASEDEAVCGEALVILRSISRIYASLDHFRNPNIIPLLIRLGDLTDKMEWLQNITWITCRLCMRRGVNYDECPGKLEKIEPWMLPSLPEVREVVQLLLIVMRGRNDEAVGASIAQQTGYALSLISDVEGGFEVIATSGIDPLMAESLSSSSKEARLSATFAITQLGCVAKSNGETLQFFHVLKGSSGMKELSRNIYPASDDSDVDVLAKKKCSLQLHLFLGKLGESLRGELRPAMIEAMLESGIVHTLVTFLEKEAPPSEVQMVAMFVLENVMRSAGKKNVDLFLGMGVVPLLLEQLKNTATKNRARLVLPLCIRHLIQANPTLRDDIVNRGGFQQMIQVLKKEYKDADILPSVMIFLKDTFHQRPKLKLEQFDGLALADGLKLVWGNMPRFSRKSMENADNISTMIFICLKEIADYGAGGIELIRKSGGFGVLIDGLSSELLGVQELAMEMIVHAALLKQENREALLRLGVVDKFPGLFRNSSDKIIHLVLICLKVFLDGKLSAAQTKAILRMKAIVEEELLRDLQVTTRAATMLLSRMGEVEK